MGMEGLVWYSIVLNTRDRHLSSCYVEKLPTYLPTYLDRIDYYLKLSDACRNRIQRIGHACLSSTHLFQLVPSITQPPNQHGGREYIWGCYVY